MEAVTTPTADERLIDRLVELYLGWREECVAVQDAYARWTGATTDERGLAHAAYSAALDREEQAAQVYGKHSESVPEWLDAAHSLEA